MGGKILNGLLGLFDQRFLLGSLVFEHFDSRLFLQNRFVLSVTILLKHQSFLGKLLISVFLHF